MDKAGRQLIFEDGRAPLPTPLTDRRRAARSRSRHQDARHCHLRCGLALCHQRTTIQRGKWGRDRETLAALIKSRSIKGIVLGLPRNMDGAAKARALRPAAPMPAIAPKAFALPDPAVGTNRWSTPAAEAAMIGQDMSRARRAAAIDAHAAAIIPCKARSTGWRAAWL